MVSNLNQSEALFEKDLIFEDKKNDYFTILKDSKGNSVSFCYSDSNSETPFSGFSKPIPGYFTEVIKECLQDDPTLWKSSLSEVVKAVSYAEDQYVFIVTMIRIAYQSSFMYQYLIRCIDNIGSEDTVSPGQLTAEKYLYDVNYKCISSVSHDFRTPLSIIYANLQLLEQHESQLDEETIKDAFSLSRMAVKSLLRVLDKVTVVDSMNKGRLEFKPGVYNLKQLCENLVKELNHAEVINDRVSYEHDSKIGDVKLDEYLFVSLFTHLIFNALSYSRKNHKVLFESKVEDNGFIKFVVQDFGIGMKEEQKEALTVFFATSVAELPEGIGLGFAIVKECLNLQKGKITITSEIGKGSIFTIYLPISSLS